MKGLSGVLRIRRPDHRPPKRFRILGGGLRSWLAVRCTPGLSLTSLRPVSGGPFRKRPCTERVDAPHPARRQTEAYPLRYGEGWRRSRCGCSGPRMPGSDGMGPWRPVLLRLLRPVPGPGPLGDAGEGREAAYGARKQASPRRAGIRPKSAIRSERAQGRERSFAGPAPASPGPRMRASRCGGAA